MRIGFKTVAAFGLVAVCGLAPTFANATPTNVETYVGRGVVTDFGSALYRWMGNSNGYEEFSTTATTTVSGTTGTIGLSTATISTINVPLALNLTVGSGSALSNSTNFTLYSSNAGNLNAQNPLLSGNNVVMSGASGSTSTITLSGFSSGVYGFGFYLQNDGLGFNGQRSAIVIRLTDANGNRTNITVSATGVVSSAQTNTAGGAVSAGSSVSQLLGLSNTNYQMKSSSFTGDTIMSDNNSTTDGFNSEFIGFTNLPGITSIAVLGGSQTGYLIGDFFVSTEAPEPASMALLGAGLLGLGLARRRKG